MDRKSTSVSADLKPKDKKSASVSADLKETKAMDRKSTRKSTSVSADPKDTKAKIKRSPTDLAAKDRKTAGDGNDDDDDGPPEELPAYKYYNRGNSSGGQSSRKRGPSYRTLAEQDELVTEAINAVELKNKRRFTFQRHLLSFFFFYFDQTCNNLIKQDKSKILIFKDIYYL